MIHAVLVAALGRRRSRSIRFHPCRASSTTQSVSSNLSCSFNISPPFPDVGCSVFCISSQPVRLLPQLCSALGGGPGRNQAQPSLLLVILRVNQVCTPKKEKVFNPFRPLLCRQISWICERFKIRSTCFRRMTLGLGTNQKGLICELSLPILAVVRLTEFQYNPFALPFLSGMLQCCSPFLFAAFTSWSYNLAPFSSFL
jgi:hypothetical protein